MVCRNTANLPPSEALCWYKASDHGPFTFGRAVFRAIGSRVYQEERDEDEDDEIDVGNIAAVARFEKAGADGATVFDARRRS
ncbi:MAG: hypothetical protein VYE81_03075 [Planctomycetota bacterium]|nr:hypothetical protein [Planctomycetota bacterium]